MTSFLSLIDILDFRLGRRDVRVWSPNPVEGFSCKSFFRILVNHSSVVESVFIVLWSLKIPKKSGSLSGKFCLVLRTQWLRSRESCLR